MSNYINNIILKFKREYSKDEYVSYSLKHGFDIWDEENRENHNFDLGYRQAILNVLKEINIK